MYYKKCWYCESTIKGGEGSNTTRRSMKCPECGETLGDCKVTARVEANTKVKGFSLVLDASVPDPINKLIRGIFVKTANERFVSEQVVALFYDEVVRATHREFGHRLNSFEFGPLPTEDEKLVAKTAKLEFQLRETKRRVRTMKRDKAQKKIRGERK